MFHSVSAFVHDLVLLVEGRLLVGENYPGFFIQAKMTFMGFGLIWRSRSDNIPAYVKLFVLLF